MARVAKRPSGDYDYTVVEVDLPGSGRRGWRKVAKAGFGRWPGGKGDARRFAEGYNLARAADGLTGRVNVMEAVSLLFGDRGVDGALWYYELNATLDIVATGHRM